MKSSADLSRRSFLSAAAFASAATVLPGGRAVARIVPAARSVPRRTAGKLRVASVGCGGMGSGDLASIASHPDVVIAAVCDVDAKRLAEQATKYNCRAEKDLRVLLRDQAADFDAVIVSTPDHSHALAAVLALRAGKHVYCQKPLVHNIREARTLSDTWLTRRDKLATQMGTQRAATAGKRLALQYFADGLIGKAVAVHAWSDRPTAGYPFGHGGNRPLGADPVPKELDWPLWLGGAPWRPFKEGQYAPFQWRAYRDFGTGAVGDMGCHILDTAFFALGLGKAITVRSQCKESTAEQCPTSQRCDLVFPGTPATAADRVPVTWYDGQWPMDFAAMRIPEDEGAKLPANTCIIVGETGTLMAHMDGENRLYRNGKREELKAAGLPGLDHYHQWVDACLGRAKTRTPFDFAANMTEALLLSAIASQFPEQDLAWDAPAMRFSNHAGANTFVGRIYTTGFEVTSA